MDSTRACCDCRAIGHGVVRRTELDESLPPDPVWTNAGRTSLYAILKALDLPAA